MLKRSTTPLKRTPMKPREKPMRRASKGLCAQKRAQRRAYAAAADAEQEYCSACGAAGEVEHSHLFSQGNYPEHRNNPLNWLISCRKCHSLFENNKHLFAQKYPAAWAEIIRRMQAIDPKAYDFYAATIPELYPD